MDQGEDFWTRVTAWDREDFSRGASFPSATYDLDFWYLPGVNAGRWSPRAAPFYLVTITLGCMKCATGIQPSPHNSPIYDWAKLLSMRRIKSSRAGPGKIRGAPRREAAPPLVAVARRVSPMCVISGKRGRIAARGHGNVAACRHAARRCFP